MKEIFGNKGVRARAAVLIVRARGHAWRAARERGRDARGRDRLARAQGVAHGCVVVEDSGARQAWGDRSRCGS